MPKCRMIAKSTGKQCKNDGRNEFAGFCRHHAPILEKKLANTWKEKLKTGTLLITYGQVIYQLIRLAIPSLPELFGDGDDSVKSKRFLESKLFDQPVYPELPDSYSPGARVDWDGLKEIYNDIKAMENNPNELTNLTKVYEKVDNWFLNLNDFHKALLFESIENFKETEQNAS